MHTGSLCKHGDMSTYTDRIGSMWLKSDTTLSLSLIQDIAHAQNMYIHKLNNYIRLSNTPQQSLTDD